MGGLNSGPGPGITLLIAIVLVLAQTASSAPLYEDDEGQENNSQSLAESHACYYNFQHYNEGERILTNEPCLNCTCRNRMLMCYLRVCPFTKGIGQNCTVEKVPGQCCPIITCPEVPVHLLTSTTTEGFKAPGGHHGTKGTEVGHLDTNGCNIDGIFYPNGAQVPGSPEKPCELCYCIRNKTACIMQECALHVDGCRPVYEEGQCFPVRYQCDDSPYEEEPTTTIRPAPTPGLIITTTSAEPLDCTYNNEVYEDGSRIQTEDPCEHCYCLKGKIACAVQECGVPLEKEGQNCTALPPAPGKCCPDSYQCDVTMTSQGLNYDTERTTETGIPSVADAGHPTDGYHPDQGIKTTQKPSHATNLLDHVTEAVTPSKSVGEQKPTITEPQELDKGTQNELIGSHLQGLHPMKPVSTSDDNQSIASSTEKNEEIITPEIGRPEATHMKENESYGHTTDDLTNEKMQPNPESVSHVLDFPTKGPETAQPDDHSGGTFVEHPDVFGIHGQTIYNSTTNNVLNLKPQTSASDAKDPLLDKLHNIIQDVQAQVSDGKTTEMPEQVDYQTTTQSQTGHFTDKPEILSHLPQFGSQTSSSGLVEMGSTANETSPDDSNDIINKLQGIIQGIYSQVTDSVTSTRTPESSTKAGETQSNVPVSSSGIIRPEGESGVESPIPEKESLKPHKGSDYSVKPGEAHRPHDTESIKESEIKDQYPFKQTTEKSQPEMYDADHLVTIGTIDIIQGTKYPDISEKPQDSKYTSEMSSVSHGSEYPEGTSATGVSGDSSSKYPRPAGTTPEGLIKIPIRPKPEGSYDEPYKAKHPETTNDAEEEEEKEEVWSTDHPYVTDRPQESSNYSEKINPEGGANYPGGSSTTKRPFEKDSGGHKPDQVFFGMTVSLPYPTGFSPSEKHPGLHPEEDGSTVQYPDAVETTQQNFEEITSSEHHFEKFQPGQQHLEGISPTSQYPEGFTSEQSNEFKPTKLHLEEGKPTEQYSESVKPSVQYSEKNNLTELEGYKPGQQYFEGSKPTEQHPDEVTQPGQYFEEHKPAKPYPQGFEPSQHLTGLKPGQEHHEGSKPAEYYPERTKPDSPKNTSFHISYPEDETGKPDEKSKYPETIGFVPSGQYPEKTKPTDQFSNGSEQPTGTKPLESDSAPFEHLEGLTKKPSSDKKYPQSSEYPDKIGQTEPESSSSESPVKFDIKPLDSSAVNNKPDSASKYPEKLKPVDEYLVTEKPNYSTKYPEKSGITDLPDSFTRDPDVLKPGKPGTTDQLEYSVTYSHKNKTEHSPYENQHHEDIGFTKTSETSTKYFESGEFKPDSQSKYPEIYEPGKKATENYPKYPEMTEFTDRPKDQTNYPESFIPTTRYPDNYKPDDLLDVHSIKDSIDKNRPHSSAESENRPTENQNETGTHSRPKPESNIKPSGTQYPQVTDRPEIFNDTGVTGSLVTFSKYPEKTKPEETLHEAEHSEEVTGKPDDKSKYSEIVKPVGEYPDGSKIPVTGKPEISKRPYTSEHPEGIGATEKPEKESKYPERLKPTDENAQRPKPGSEDEFYGSNVDKSEFPYESSTYKNSDKSSSTQKIDFVDRPDDLKPTQQYPEDSKISRPQEQSKYPQKLGDENKPYSSESPDSTGKPEEQYTEHPDYNLITKKPNDGDEYPKKQKIKNETSAEEYQTGKPDETYESTEEDTTAGRPKVPDVLDSEDKLHGTEYPEGVTGKPVGSSKYPEEIKEQDKRPQKPESEHLYEGSAERPDEEKSEQNVTIKPQGSAKYPEETYIAQYPEKTKPPSEDQLLEIDIKPEGLEKHPVKTKPTPEPAETDKLVNGTKYSDKLKPSSGLDLMTRPSNSNQPDISGHSEQPGKFTGIYESLDGTTKSPHYTAQYPQKPSDKSPGSEYSEEMDKPQYTEESESSGKPEPEDVPYGTEYPKRPGFDEIVHAFSTEEIATSRPQDMSKIPLKSKPESLDKPKDQIKYTTISDFEEELITTSATDKPEDKQKYPIKTKPGTDHQEINGTERPLSIKEGISKPEHTDQEPEKYIPTSTEKLGVTYPPDEGSKNSQAPIGDTFGTEYPDSETGTGRPEDSSKHSVESKPVEQKHPQGTDYPELSSKPEYESKYPKYPESSTQTGQYAQRPYDSQSFPGSEYPDNEMTGTPEHHTRFPEGNEVEHYPELTEGLQYSTKYPEGEKLHDLELPHGTESPAETLEYHTKYPDKFIPQQFNKYPGSSAQHPEETTDYTKYPESVTALLGDRTKYPEGFKPTEYYTEANGNLHGSTKYPEGDHSFTTKYPGLGLTEKSEDLIKHPADFKPEGLYPEQPQISEENPDLSTEYLGVGETDRPNLSTKYSEKDKVHVTDEYSAIFGVTRKPSSTEYNEGSKPTDSLYGTEPTHLSGTLNEYAQKFKPEHDRPHPESLTEHPAEEKPTKTYTRPEGEEQFDNSVTVGSDSVTKVLDDTKPVGSETTVYGTEFPEKVTDKPENVKYSEGLKYPSESGTKYPETSTGEPIKENIYSEEFSQTAEYPYGSVEYSPRPKPESENKPYVMEHPETVTTSEGQMGFTRYPYESNTAKHSQRPESAETTVFGLPDDFNKYPHGLKPGSGDYPENLGINGRPQGSMNYPQKKPSLEGEHSSNQYLDETNEPESSTRFPDGKKPEDSETFDKPGKNKYPEDSKYSEIIKPDLKHPQRPKPAVSYDSPYGTAYPETTEGSEGGIGITETPEYLGQHPSAQYPQRPKPGSEGEGEEYPQGIGSTEKPDDESKYPDKTGYLTKRPFLGRPKPIGSNQSFVSESPNIPGQTSSTTYPETPQPGFEDEHYSNIYSETTNKPVPEDKLHGTKYPEVSKPDVSGQPYTSTKYSEAFEEQEVTGHPSESEETSPVLHSQDPKKPQETASPNVSGTEEYPNEFKPVGEYLKPSERPHVPSKYPVKPKPSTSGDDSLGAGYLESSEKPEDELFGTQHPKEPENTLRPEHEKYPESTGKPHGIHRYPLRPKPVGFEDEPSGTEYPETTEELDETSTVQEQDGFSKNPVRLKPPTKYPEESYVTFKPVEPSKYPDKIKPEDNQFFSTEFSEEKRPEEYKPFKHSISSYHPESITDKTPFGTELPNVAIIQPNNESKHPEAFNLTEKHPDESGLPKKPYSSVKHPETPTESAEKPYNTENPVEEIGVTKHPEGSEPQKVDDEINTNELFGVTRKPVSSFGIPAHEFSTTFFTPKPGTAYLPQEGELPNEKIPNSQDLNVNSTSVSSSTEIYFGSPAEGNLPSTLSHFGSHQDKPPSVDLSHELGSSPSGQDLSTKYSEHTTTPSDVHKPGQFSTKPTDEAKPTELEINAPVSADDYPGRPKPVVAEELHKVQDPSFVESSSIPSKISETKRPEILSSPEVAGIKKPDDQYQSSEVEGTQYPSQYFSTSEPGVHEYPDSTHSSISNVKLPENISTFKPGDYYTTTGKHKSSTLRQPNDKNPESTDHLANGNTHLEETFSTESATEYITQENYPEGISLPDKGFTRKPTQDSGSFVDSTTDASQDVYLPEKVTIGAYSGVQKTTTLNDNDLIDKLHNIISGIQSQVNNNKTTRHPYGGYESTTPRLPTHIPQDLVTDKSDRPEQKPQESVEFPHEKTPESLSTPSRHPIDKIFSSENEIHYQTTTDLEKIENQTDKPQFSYTFGSGSTDHSAFVTSESSEGVRPTEMTSSFSTKNSQHETATGFPVTMAGKPEITEFPELGKPHEVKYPEVPKKDAVTSYPEQSSPISKYPTDKLEIGKTKPESSIPTELPDIPIKPDDKYPEETPDSASYSHYPEDISTTANSVISFEDSGKPDLSGGSPGIVEAPTKTVDTNIQDTTTQIYQEIKKNQIPIENVDSLIAKSNKTAPHKEDLSQEMAPQNVKQKHPISVPTDKPLHVVYPTYYPDGVVTRAPETKPDGETDKKVTVTPQNTVYQDTTIKSTESDATVASKFGETHTTTPIIVIQEVHTEVHSERVPMKTGADNYIQQTTTPAGDSKPVLSTGEPHDHRPEHGFEKITKQPELTNQTPQIIFGQSSIIHGGDQLSPESQTHADYAENEKFSTLSTRPEYPTKQQESPTKPGFVTVTPIGIVPITKDTENIMHLYSSKNKHPTSTSSIQYPESFSTASPVYPEGVKHTTEKKETAGLTEIQTNFVTDQSIGTTHAPEIFSFRKTTQKPTDGVPELQEGTTTITPTQGIGEEYEVPHALHPGITKRPSFDILTEGLPTQDKTPEIAGFTTTKEGMTHRPQGASFVPYKLINGNKVYYPEKESPERPILESSPFDGYDQVPYEIVNGTKFFYPNRIVTSQPTTTSAPMGMYVPYKIVNGSKIYYTQDKTQKPEKFDGLDYVPFDIINGTKIFYPEKVTTTPSPASAMYVPFKIIDGTKVYYTKEAQEEPQNIPDEFDGFDYVPYSIVNGSKIFRPDHTSNRVPPTTEHLPAMYIPYKLLNGNKVYYPNDTQIKPETVPEEYDGFDLVPYEVVNGTKLFHPEPVTTPEPEKVTTKISAMFAPYKIINGTKVYFPKYAQNKPTHLPEGYDGFDYLPYEVVNGTKVFRPEKVTPKPEFTSTPAFYSNGMFVPYKIINNTKVFFPKDAQHKPRPLKPGYDGVQYLPYDVINGTKVFYPERATTPTPIVPSAVYIPYKLINGTKVYYADKATENPEKIPEGYEGFDYVPYEIISGNKLPHPDRLTPTMGMYVPYKKLNGSKVYYPKDSSEKRHPIPEGYDGADYIPYEIINGTKVFYPDRVTIPQPTPIMYVPYKMVNGTKVYYPKDAQSKPYLVTEGYDGFDSVPYEIVNGTNVFHPEDVTQRPTPTYSQGMFVPYKMINGTKVYYPQEAHKRPHPLSDEYAGLDYIPYEVVNGTKVFHPERLTPGEVPAMYVPYKLINGTKVYFPKHAQHNPQQILPEYDGFDYVPYEIINGSQVFYPNRVPNYQGIYVPYKIINGEKVFYPKYAQHKPSEVFDKYDGFDYLPFQNVNGTNIIKPMETITETPFEQAMYVPYKVVNGTKVFYADYAQYKPHLIPPGFDGFDYIPYEIINGTKVFDPDLAVTPSIPYKPAMYIPFKIIDGKKVYYPKHAQNEPHLVPEGYDGYDYIPYEIVNGTKIFDPEQTVAPGPDIKPGLYVPYKIMNGIKVYQPKYAQHKPSHLPQDYEGFDYLPYDVVNGNKVFYPEQSVPLKQAMYVPFKYINRTKVFYPKDAQHVPIQTPEDYDGLEYIPYEIVKGDKVFHPEQAITTETPFKKAVYVPYKVLNGTKIYYPKNSHHNPYLIPQGYDGFDYIPYEVVNGSKVFYPEQATTPETSFKQAMYVPFRVVNGTKVYYPKHAQSKPLLSLENYDGFDYLPYKIVNGMKVFDAQVPSRPTYLQGMYVPYKSVNNTKVFYPKDAHNKPNYVPEGYDGADYVPYESLNNTKMFYPELISTAQPSKQGSAGVYVPFKVVNNKKVFYPKEATPFPPTVRYPYDGVAFVPHKMLDETSPSEIVYVDDNEIFKPHKPPLQLGKVPGEGSCYIKNKTFANNTEIPPVNSCQASCVCVSSVVRCVRVKCPSAPEDKLDCSPVFREGSCCPTYVCEDSNFDDDYSTTTEYSETKVPEFAGSGSSGQGVDAITPITGYGTQKKPSYELEDVTAGKKPEVQAPSEEYHLHKPPKPKPEHESLEPYDNVEGQLTLDEDYDVEDEEPYGPGTCRYAGKVYVSAQQIPRDDPCDFCFCFRSDIICLQQSCPPPIPGCRDEPIQGFCCPRYECHVKMATMINVTSTTTTTTTTLPPHFFPHAFKGSATKTGCFVQGRAYRVGQAISSASGPCMDCICGGNGRMKCEPKVCTPEPMIRKMINPSESVTSPSNER